MTNNITKASLPQEWIDLIETIGRLGFGRIENLTIRQGKPILDPKPTFVRFIKCGGKTKPRPEAYPEDFVVKAKILDLIKSAESLGDGVIPSIEVQDGLPFSLTILDTAA